MFPLIASPTRRRCGSTPVVPTGRFHAGPPVVGDHQGGGPPTYSKARMWGTFTPMWGAKTFPVGHDSGHVNTIPFTSDLCPTS